MKKIVHILQKKQRNKYSYLLSLIMDSLKSTGEFHQVVIHPAFLPQLDRLKDDGLEIEYIDFTGLRFFKKFLRLVNFVNKKEIHVIHCHDFISLVMAYCLSFFCEPVQLVYSVYEERLSVYMKPGVALRGRMVLRFEEWMSSRIAKILLFSEEIYRVSRNTRIPAEKLNNCHFGIAAAPVSPDADVVQEIRRKCGAGRTKKIVCIFGRFERVKKGFDIWRRVVAEYEKRSEKKSLLFAVHGAQGEEFSTYLYTSGLTRKIVVIEQFYRYEDVFAAIDIVLIPSRYDNPAITILEAQKFNRPVIVSRSKTAAVYVEAGRTGFMTSTGSWQEILDALLKLENEPAVYEDMVAALKSQPDRFPITALTDTLCIIYNSLG